MEIDYIQRLATGEYIRGTVVSGEAVESAIFLEPDNYLSLNIARDFISGLERSGSVLKITLSDGSVIEVEGVFDAQGEPSSRVFFSCGGVLYEVLWSNSDSLFYLGFVEEDPLGKEAADLGFTDVCRMVFEERVPLEDLHPALALLPLSLLAFIQPDDSEVDTTPPMVTFNEDQVGGDGIVNDIERRSDVLLTGLVEENSVVLVTIDGMTFEAVVEGGKWSLLLPPDVLTVGEYLQNVTIEAVDQYGNTSEISGDFRVDTEIDLTVDARRVEGNGVVNNAERIDGVIITGASDPGATVMVQMNGHSHTAVADANGKWSVTFAASQVRPGTYDAPVSVTATDAAGNQTTVNTSIKIDTEASIAIAGPVESDGTVNAAEKADGVVLHGTTERGSVVMVTFGSVTLPATVAADGTWTVNFPSSALKLGTYETVIVANSTDVNGNTATATKVVWVDTETSVTVRTVNVEGDGTINFAERSNGLMLTGTAEAGATVVVTFAGTSRTVTANANGEWSATWTAAEILSGETTVNVRAVSTDLAGNTATTTGTVTVDTFVNRLEITSGPGGTDGIINQAEAGQAIMIDGMVEVGAKVTVTLAGVTRPAIVGSDGSWTVTFPPGSIPSGEYNTTVTVNATDRAGNTASISQDVRVDTVVGDVTLSPDPIEIDDVVNVVERSDGVLIHGTATPGLTVTVTLGGVAHQVVAGPDGYWESLYLSSEIPPGTYTSDITASITDSAGNTKTVSDKVNIDTEIFLTLTKPIEGDNILSGAEEANGLQLGGTVEKGSTVVVRFGGVDYTATVDANGNWSATIPSSAIADGEYNAPFSVIATDPAGNTTTLNDEVRVDTLVNRLSLNVPVEGDNTINFVEALDGVVFTGSVEPGSTVVVTFGQETRVASVSAEGIWLVNFSVEDMPPGEYQTNVSVTATDLAGNTRSVSQALVVDTIIPVAPIIVSFGVSGGQISNLTVPTTTDDVDLQVVAGNGSVTDPIFDVATNEQFGETTFRLRAPIPNGSHLVITSTDDAGNNTSTLFVLEESLTNAVDVRNAGLDGFNIEAIDLQFAEDSQLTLTVADLEALSAASNTLTVHGRVDDTVTILGATDTGEVQEIGGRTYKVYDFGPNGGSVIIDEEINVVT